jgi:hypothetical protein
MNAEHTSVGWRFGLLWALLTAIGWIIGFPLGFVLGESWLGYVGLETCIGALVGFMQWLALRRVIPRAGFWVVANIIVFIVSSSIHTAALYVWQFPDDMGIPLGALIWTIIFVAAGALTGTLQQRILRRHVCRSGWWIPTSAIGWGLGIAGFDMLGLGIAYKISKPLLAFSVLGLVLHGIVTGAVLIWLLRQPAQQTTDTCKKST